MNIEEYLKRQNELLERLSKINSEDFKTKKQIIEELIDATRPLIETGYYQWKKWFFASFIYQQLEQYQIEYPRNQAFYQLFEDTEKREEVTNFESTSGRLHQHEFEGDDHVKKCECGAIQFESLIYGVEPPKEKTYSSEEVKKMIDEKPDPYSNPYTEYIQRVKFNCDQLGSYCNELVKKYYTDENVAKTIELGFSKHLNVIEHMIKEQKSIEAKLIHMGKQSDFRQKIGEFEKIKAIILEKNSKYGIAGVAKLLTNLEKCKKCGFTHMGISPKHQSVNIMKNTGKFLNNMKWFRSLIFKCKSCQAENVIELADWYNESIERKNLGLDMLTMP